MAKTPTCKNCGTEGHYKTWCPSLPNKPIKSRSAKSKAKKVKTPKKKAETRSQLVKKLDKVFSEYIRRSKPPVCVTCGKKDEWKNLQNGHYYSRSKYPTRWHEDNCHPQCVGCNVFKSGNYTEYALYMVEKYGIEYIQELHRLANSGEKITTPQLREMLEDYKQKCIDITI